MSHRDLWGPAVDQILADESVTSLSNVGDVVYPLGDNLGTPRDLAEYDAGNDDTTVANHRVLDSYGILISESDSGVSILFGFTARPLDESTGLQNNLNRWYAFGQWLSEDPIGFAGGDQNVSRYVFNSPLNLTDPSGLIHVYDQAKASAESRDADYYAWRNSTWYNRYLLDPAGRLGLWLLMASKPTGGDMFCVPMAAPLQPAGKLGKKFLEESADAIVKGIKGTAKDVVEAAGKEVLETTGKVAVEAGKEISKDAVKETGELALSAAKAPNKVTTPNAAARAISQGEYIDPLTNKVVKTTETLAADHIFPKARIKELPGFKELSLAQQSEVLNNLENFRGLPQSLNASKGSRIDWSKCLGQPLDSQYAKELAELQQVMKAEIQAQINALRASQK